MKKTIKGFNRPAFKEFLKRNSTRRFGFTECNCPLAEYLSAANGEPVQATVSGIQIVKKLFRDHAKWSQAFIDSVDDYGRYGHRKITGKRALKIMETL